LKIAPGKQPLFAGAISNSLLARSQLEDGAVQGRAALRRDTKKGAIADWRQRRRGMTAIDIARRSLQACEGVQ
jgi:hypothetical protein